MHALSPLYRHLRSGSNYGEVFRKMTPDPPVLGQATRQPLGMILQQCVGLVVEHICLLSTRRNQRLRQHGNALLDLVYGHGKVEGEHRTEDGIPYL